MPSPIFNDCAQLDLGFQVLSSVLTAAWYQKSMTSCKEYYSDLFNHPPAPLSDELANVAAEAVPESTSDCSPPAEEEVERAVESFEEWQGAGAV